MAPTYEERLRGFDWQQVADELGYREGDPLNIGWYCSDRICEMGKDGSTRSGRSGSATIHCISP